MASFGASWLTVSGTPMRASSGKEGTSRIRTSVYSATVPDGVPSAYKNSCAEIVPLSIVTAALYSIQPVDTGTGGVRAHRPGPTSHKHMRGELPLTPRTNIFITSEPPDHRTLCASQALSCVADNRRTGTSPGALS